MESGDPCSATNPKGAGHLTLPCSHLFHLILFHLILFYIDNLPSQIRKSIYFVKRTFAINP